MIETEGFIGNTNNKKLLWATFLTYTQDLQAG